MANYRANNNDASNTMAYDRYGAYGPANHAYGNSNAGYNSPAYGYNPNGGSQPPIDPRSNSFYAPHQHQPYDPYSTMATANNYASPSHSQYAYHQRDFHSFEAATPYRTRGATGSGYMMRDPYQHPYANNNQTHCGDYMPTNGMVGNGVGNVSPSTTMLSPAIKVGPQHHHPHAYQPMHGPSFGDFHKNMPMANNQYVTEPNGFPPHSATGKYRSTFIHFSEQFRFSAIHRNEEEEIRCEASLA